MVTNRINVLVSPAHLVLSDVRGSESTWALNIMRYVNNNYEEVFFDAVCGSIELQKHIPRLAIYSLMGECSSSLDELYRRHLYKLSFMGSYYNLCRRLLRQKSFHVVHHMFPFGFRVGLNPLAVLGGLGCKPFVVGPIQYPQLFEEAKLSKKLERRVMRVFSKPIGAMNVKTLDRSDALVFDSRKTLDLYKQTYNDRIRHKKLVVIPAGIETEIFRFTRPPAKEYLNLLTVGYLVERKGIQHLLMAMTFIGDSRDVRLKIVGSGPYESTLKRIAKKLGIEEKVTFEGYISRSNITRYYAGCDIYVHPTLSETFPYAIKEAMAVGRPIVATRVGFVDEHIKDGVHGYLVPPREPKALADVIMKLLGDAELRHRMGSNARQYVEENLRWDRIAKKWYELYLDLAEKA